MARCLLCRREVRTEDAGEEFFCDAGCCEAFLLQRGDIDPVSFCMSKISRARDPESLFSDPEFVLRFVTGPDN
jgi:hypothetical protein